MCLECLRIYIFIRFCALPWKSGEEGTGIRFQDMPYQRVTYEEVERRYCELIRAVQTAADGAACIDALHRRGRLLEDMTSMELCYVRHDMDVNDSFYTGEQDYYDEIGPKLSDLANQFDRALLASPHRDALEQVLGRQAIAMMERTQEGFDSRLIPLAQEENELLSRYNQISSNAAALWDGARVKLNLMIPYLQSPDRETRRKASLAVSAAREGLRGELEELYSLLVDNRTRQAKLMGLSSYTQMSYRLMCRLGYGPEDVRRFREHVKRYIVPLHIKLEERRRRRLGLEKLYSYDSGISFLNGNPKPVGDTEFCLAASREMYTRMSPETAGFIAFLLDNGLYDVEIRDGKRDGGYMTFFEKYRAPFIFANFDGTSENAYIMCHEGGHAFQGYLKRNEDLRELRSFTSESAETHAMSMEFFAWPYMELFFGDCAEDYRTMHLEGAVELIISECLQDEFQELIYDKPDLTPDERNALWARLGRAYWPIRDYDDDKFALAGCGWQRIPHMFQWPFYAIDYALAQVCALEYLRWMNEDHAAAWNSYLGFCRRTGTDSFPSLVRSAGLGDPFEERTLADLTDWLNQRLLSSPQSCVYGQYGPAYKIKGGSL